MVLPTLVGVAGAVAVGTTLVGAAAAAAVVESGFRRLRLRRGAVAAAVMVMVAAAAVTVMVAAAVMVMAAATVMVMAAAVMVASVMVVGNLRFKGWPP
jgi:hypothetical protein